MSSFMLNRTLLPDSDVYLVSSNSRPYLIHLFLVMSHNNRQANTVQ
ncbi:hypothetical protein T11_16054 [Trichinella zimbabwensis]|uniref:Uncharacterized protein n=1 Tax=Trichinella zimbabwensis TaxID=268475 RepID=A0A0V1GGH2_9BILA|nr:hypothetical protein T11_16054 [Trichinella zimbabwensis]